MADARERMLAPLREHQHAPFEPGNAMAQKHGAQVAAVRLEGRARELADVFREELTEDGPATEVMLLELGLVLTRIERGAAWLDQQPELVTGKGGKPWPLLDMMARWEAQALKLLDRLGLSPQSKAAIRSQDALADYLARRDGDS